MVHPCPAHIHQCVHAHYLLQLSYRTCPVSFHFLYSAYAPDNQIYIGCNCIQTEQEQFLQETNGRLQGAYSPFFLTTMNESNS